MVEPGKNRLSFEFNKELWLAFSFVLLPYSKKSCAVLLVPFQQIFSLQFHRLAESFNYAQE
jgi:hypothetical protein